MQNRKGFTLVEMLFTLFIITLLSLVSLTFYNTKSDEKIVLENYMEVKSIIEEARTIALTTHRKVSLEINKNRIGYQNDSHERILELSKDIELTGIKKIHFNENGVINQGNHMFIGTSNLKFKIVFNIGSGDFYLQQ